ncbi:MAG: glycoside hydrolase family 13 protein [Bacteroidota bacterium]
MKNTLFIGLLFTWNTVQAQFVQDSSFLVPEWAAKVVWYQIFPERFRNGDPKNDPILKDQAGSYPFDINPPWEVHPWGSDWYEMQAYEKQNGKDFWYNVQRRRYGGDLQGIIDKLDYLKSLGIGAIYLNPIFYAPSHHKYDQICYHHVDPSFGPDPVGDKKIIEAEKFSDPDTWKWTKADKLALKLIEEVHRRGMYIIFDGVFNHMGQESVPFKDVVKHQQKSRYKYWFQIKTFEDKKKGIQFDYEGWFGIKQLPELNEDEEGLVNGPREYVLKTTERWMNPDKRGTEFGVDGWRLDVAFCMKHPFWRDYRRWVKLINPEAYLTAEVVDSIPVLKPYLNGDEFDAVMNYNFSFACYEFMMCDNTAIKASEFDARLQLLRKAFPGQVSYVMQNLFDSHDTNRLSSMIYNADKYSFRNWGDYFGKSQVQRNPEYDSGMPDEKTFNKMKLCVLFQMMYVGAPMIYYGDEQGMWGANDPDCRKPMLWPDIAYTSEKYLPDQTTRNRLSPVRINNDIYEYYRQLIQIRNSTTCLQTGSYKTLYLNDSSRVMAFERVLNDQRIVVIMNASAQALTLPMKEIAPGVWYNMESKKKFRAKRNDSAIELNPYDGIILKQLK